LTWQTDFGLVGLELGTPQARPTGLLRLVALAVHPFRIPLTLLFLTQTLEREP
jgi:hypothetical protein